MQTYVIQRTDNPNIETSVLVPGTKSDGTEYRSYYTLRDAQTQLFQVEQTLVETNARHLSSGQLAHYQGQQSLFIRIIADLIALDGDPMVDEDGANLDPALCDCGKGDLCPLNK